MSINLSIIGQEQPSTTHSWTSKDALLYALGVGAGLEDPLAELQFTTENSHEIKQQVLPTFAVMLSGYKGGGMKLGDFSMTQLLHADQTITLYGPLPVAGTARSTSRITNIYDKGSGALIMSEAHFVDAESGQPLATSTNGIFIRGEGGFGGERGPTSDWTKPDRAPDYSLTYQTAKNQALLYRLSGDRNPLHSDPWFAEKAHFPLPILHGLCTYGFTGRAILQLCCGGDPAVFGSMYGRFTRSVYPGQQLEINVWEEGSRYLFQTKTDSSETVIDNGTFTRRAS